MTPIETIDSLIDAVKRRDLGAVLAKVAPDVSWQGPDSIPWGGIHKGPDGVKTFFTRLGENFEMSGVNVHDRFASGDNVVVLGDFQGKGRRTGKPATVGFCWVWRVKNGLVGSLQSHIDTAAVMSAIN
jgi:uncharacterized protein